MPRGMRKDGTAGRGGCRHYKKSPGINSWALKSGDNLLSHKSLQYHRPILRRGINSTKKESQLLGTLSLKKWRWPTLPQIFAVPSALLGLTSLFGMGRGGSPTLSIALIRDRSIHIGTEHSKKVISKRFVNCYKLIFLWTHAERLEVLLKADDA